MVPEVRRKYRRAVRRMCDPALRARAGGGFRPVWVVRAAVGQVGSGGSIIIAIIAIIVIVIAIIVIVIVIIAIIVIVIIVVSLQKLPADFAARVG